MRYSPIALAILCLVVIGSTQHDASSIMVKYERPQDVTNVVTAYNNLTKIGLSLVDVQVLSMDDTPRYPLDDADLVKVRISVTNNGANRFTVLDKMFEILVMEPTKMGSNDYKLVDNYDTSYDDQLAVTYEEMNSRELFNECDRTIEHIDPGKSFDFTLCYDILKIRHGYSVDLDGPRKYVLVMMDNQQASSCPNCKKITLTSDLKPHAQVLPEWIQNLFRWKERHIISESDLQRALGYLAERGIITTGNSKLTEPMFLKNKELAEYQAVLAAAYNKNLHVSSIEFFEPMHSDGFSGVTCKKQNNIVSLEADYANDNTRYDTIFFRLMVYDESGKMVGQGMAKIVNVAPNAHRHFEVSTPLAQTPQHCVVVVDAKFS